MALLSDYIQHRSELPSAIYTDGGTIKNYGSQLRITDWMSLNMIGSTTYPHLRQGSWISTSGFSYVKDSLNNVYDIMVSGPTCKLSDPEGGIPTKAVLSITDNNTILGSGTYRFNDDKFTTTSSPQEMRNIQELILTEILQVTERDCDLYVQDGLISMWDGQYNTRAGHNTSTATWEDLVGTNNMTVGAGTFLDKSYSVSTYRCALLSSQITGVVTIEVCCKRTGQSGMLFCYDYHHPASNNQFIGIGFGTDTVGFKGGTDQWYMCPSVLHDSPNTYSYTGTNMYWNGVPQQANARTGSYRVNSGYLGVNCYYSNSYNFVGEIYSIRLYNRALTAEEITYNRNIDEKRFNPAPDYRGYVQSGLISMWDGEWNSRKGHQMAVPEVWEDLVGNNNFYAYRNDGRIQYFIDKYFASSPSSNENITVLNNAIPNVVTTEICFHYEPGGTTISNSNAGIFGYDYPAGTNQFSGFGVYGVDTNTFRAYFESGGDYFIANKQDLNTYSRSGQNMYLNGTAKPSEGNVPSVTALRLSIRGWSNSRTYNIRLYDRALTADEILHNYYVDRLRFAGHI